MNERTLEIIRFIAALMFLIAIVFVWFLHRDPAFYGIMALIFLACSVMLCVGLLILSHVVVGKNPLIAWGAYERYFIAVGTSLLVGALFLYQEGKMNLVWPTGIGGFIMTSFGVYAYAIQQNFYNAIKEDEYRQRKKEFALLLKEISASKKNKK